MNPLVTILMPNYNNEPFLKEAMDSMLNQTYKDFIFLIVDDGSTDKSVEIIKSYDDSRIKLVVKEKNSGIVDSMNIGIDLIDTKYFVRMDGDDISEPDRIRQLVDYMETHTDVGVCGSHYKLFGDKNEVTRMELNGNMIKAKLIYTNGMSHAPSIFRTEVLKKTGIRYTNNHPYMEDYDIFFRLKNSTNFVHLDQVLYHYRILKHNSTVKNIHTILDRKREMYKDVISELGIEPTNKNLDLHIQYFLGDVPLEYAMKDYRNWMITLMSKNKEKRIYPEKELDAFLTRSWERFFFKVVPISLGKMMQYFILSRKVTFAQFVYLSKVKINKLLGR